MNKRPLYQISDWNKIFENHRSRLVEQCNFICVPNKHGGVGLTFVLSQPDGLMIYGVWVMLLQLCSRQRSPRQGYLTANGDPNGYRFDNDELAGILRATRVQVERCIEVVSSERVGWLKRIDTEPNCLSATTAADSPAATGADSPAATGAATPAAMTDDERKKERKKVLSTEDFEHAKELGSTDLLNRDSAKKLIAVLSADVFGFELNEYRWTYQMEARLDAALPMELADWNLIDWCYRLPADHQLFTVTRRRQSIHALIENLASEPQKIRAARTAIGMGSLNGRSPPPDPDVTPEQLAVVRKLYGQVPVAKKWSQLPESVRHEIDTEMGV